MHLLIGNHETMNVIGDLRYVAAGEYQGVCYEKLSTPADYAMGPTGRVDAGQHPDFETMDLEAFRKEWEQQVPLGWVEHRQAWSLRGNYGKWVRGNPVAVQVNDTIFLHGGISAKYCKFSLQSLTEQVMAAMRANDPSVVSAMNDPLGRFGTGVWQRKKNEDIFSQTLDNILNRYGAKRIVIGHTPTGGVVWPRFDQRVVANDTGIATYYGSHKGLLELTPEGATAIYGSQRIPLPSLNSEREDYLRA